jgi:hypothetical protein
MRASASRGPAFSEACHAAEETAELPWPRNAPSNSCRTSRKNEKSCLTVGDPDFRRREQTVRLRVHSVCSVATAASVVPPPWRNRTFAHHVSEATAELPWPRNAPSNSYRTSRKNEKELFDCGDPDFRLRDQTVRLRVHSVGSVATAVSVVPPFGETGFPHAELASG